MAAGRNNQRRRRVILDEVAQANGLAAVPDDGSRVETRKTYSDAAKRRSQLKTTDLIPKRPWTLAITLSSVILIAIVLNLLAMSLGNWESLSESAREVFRFSGVGTLPNWFSSLLLVMSGMASLQIYGMRRHRCDDYNGHYQIWLFLAVLFIAASVNCVVDIGAVLVSAVKLIGVSGGGSGFVVFLVAKMIALTALVVRGVLEIRASRAALAAVVVVWIAYASAVVAQIPDVRQQLVQDNQLILGNLVLVGNIAVFAMTVFYSRFVYLQANGLIAVRVAETAAVEEEAPVAKTKRKQSKSKAKPQPAIEPELGKTVATAEDEQPILKLEIGTTKSSTMRQKLKKVQKQSRRAA